MTQRLDIVLDGCLGVFQRSWSQRGVIICGGHGYDELCTYRNLALFADTLAEHGVSTLRFDYHGTGNSLGSDEDEDRLETWLGNIAAAIAFMKNIAGVEEIVLVGYRLGGLLATIAASRTAEVNALLLIAPALAGRSYLREMQLQSQLYPVRQDESGKDGRISSAGFMVSAETAKSLSAIKLADIGQPHLKRTLILSSVIGAESPLVAALARHGSQVKTLPFDALADLSVDPIRSLAVDAPFAGALPFLLADLKPSNALAMPSLTSATLEGNGWREEAHRFGRDIRLFGVLCQPQPDKANGRTLLFLNGGANRCIGWSRLIVPLARHLATLGYASFRMDFSGIGESRAADPQKPVILYDNAFQFDIAAALDWLHGQGHDHVGVFGACSGAHAAFHAAAADARIKSLIMVNLLRFDISMAEASQIGGAISFRSTANYLQRMKELDGWKKLIAGGRSKAIGLAKEYRRRGGILLRSRLGHVAAIIFGNNRFAARTMSGFHTIADRRARTLIVYGDDDNGLDELSIHVGRHGSLLKAHNTVRFALIHGTDHNLTARSAQAQLTALVERFLHDRL